VKAKRGIAPSISKPEFQQGTEGYELVQLVSIQQVFDIYIPETIFNLPAVKNFFKRLGALSEGATLYQGVEGDWYHEKEAVRVLRMSITIVKPDGTVLWTEESIREAIANLVCELMVELRDSHQHFEEAIFFNDWQAKGTVVKGDNVARVSGGRELEESESESESKE
jgi:hypothetical protein